jgi:hypothetical protein
VFANYATLPTTALAGIGDYLAGAAAGAAGSSDAEEALLITKLPATTAGTAGLRLLAVGDTASSAAFASFSFADGNLCSLTEDDIFQFNADVGAQIGPTLCPAPTSSTAAERVAEAE